MKTSKELIVVLGMHRSGTSAITKSLEAIGVKFGDHLLPAIAGVNDKGFWEDFDIYHFNEKLLALVNQSWDSLELLDKEKIDWLHSSGFIEKAIELLNSKLNGEKIFAFKDPRISKLIGFWQKVFKKGNFQARYILCVRHPSGVASSLFKRDHISKEKGQLLWLTHNVNALYYLQNEQYTIVNFDNLMVNMEIELNKLFSFLGYPLKSDFYNFYKNEYLDEKLYHHLPQKNIFDIIEEFYLLMKEENIAIRNKQVQNWHLYLKKINSYLKLLDSNYHNLEEIKIDHYEKMLLTYNTQLRNLENELTCIKKSWSWRITAWLRTISKKILT
jgi:hypothetical protein